ncbi:MAG TPA: arsenic resistance N-acetyltransferase ArsN2 [Gallionella sp.]|nr:arsenic resistance N-acetyltransferase ArsN2 [Gallionella sp.]
MITFRTATKLDIPAIETLLHLAQLPVGGINENSGNFSVAAENGTLVGVAGFEGCGNIGLLRSVAVLPGYRNRGIATELCRRVMAQARQSGISALYLLTTTAQGYFAKLDFAAINRTETPEAIRKTQQFRELCPDSAIIMYRSIQ